MPRGGIPVDRDMMPDEKSSSFPHDSIMKLMRDVTSLKVEFGSATIDRQNHIRKTDELTTVVLEIRQRLGGIDIANSHIEAQQKQISSMLIDYGMLKSRLDVVQYRIKEFDDEKKANKIREAINHTWRAWLSGVAGAAIMFVLEIIARKFVG